MTFWYEIFNNLHKLDNLKKYIFIIKIVLNNAVILDYVSITYFSIHSTIWKNINTKHIVLKKVSKIILIVSNN